MLELAELVIELTGSTAGLEHRPLPSDDPRQRRPDITIAREQLDWEPLVGLREGLELTIPYFAGQLALSS
jgi:UDP-glucuronate decarboxylase